MKDCYGERTTEEDTVERRRGRLGKLGLGCDKKVIREKNEGVAEVLRRVGERDKFLCGVNIRKFAVSFKETQFLKRYVNLKE